MTDLVSPGSRPRPSLSEPPGASLRGRAICVAGVSAPAFVERRDRTACGSSQPSVSPGSRPRPSLSDRAQEQAGEHLPRCRRGLGPGLR